MAVSHCEGRRIRIVGTVQGVGFRPWVYRAARSAGVTGRVWNDAAGVTVEAFGDEAGLDRFAAALRTPPPAARIVAVDVMAIDAAPTPTFEIVESAGDGVRRVSIPPDLATCPECVEEIFDPADRRYRYPFTNCTKCGPRFTIATGVPYDRAATTMAPFEMCADCRREYENPLDRRFHAQPNACPVCGPRLTLLASDGTPIVAPDAVAAAAQLIRDGQIVAVKGIGGFHLACDATSAAAVTRLRARKHRDEKPLAVMVQTLALAERIVLLGDVERQLLASPERPIVIAERRAGCAIAGEVAPGNRMLGVFLPYSPLHHLLLADCARPLVMTSGNLADEPIAFTNDEAVRRLGPIADAILVHDRDIRTRCDDSVAAVVAGRPTLLRRSRGYVPRAIRLTKPCSRPVLATGALLKNTFCVAAGDQAWLGPHIGDLENLETFESYRDAIERMLRFLGVRPEVVAHDLHPEYLSTAYALARGDASAIGVQHHHAHVASVMAEHGLAGPVIGVAYDGTGYGTDGTMWGGEVIVATFASFERAATFRPIALAGGDRAIREPWRIALALAIDAFGEEEAERRCGRFLAAGERERRAIARVLQTRIATPLARGVGRYFDGFASLVLGRRHARFEGQTALEWDQIADPYVTRSYPFELHAQTALVEIDLRAAVRAAVVDLEIGEPASAIAAAFHNTLIDATAEAVRHTGARYGRLPVVASGGCFQNERLAEGLRTALACEFDVCLHGAVPPGDGGIALGQAVVADALWSRE